MPTRQARLGGLLVLLVAAANLPSAGSAAAPLPDGALLRMGSSRLAHGTWLTCVRFSADDRWVGAADADGCVRLWDVATGQLVWQKPKGTGRKLAFSPDGTLLAIGGYYNRAITLWDLQKDEAVRELPQNARALAFSQDGSLLAAAGRDKIVRLWDPKSGKLLRELSGHHAELYAVAFSPDQRRLASAGGYGGSSNDNEIRLWDVATGEQLGILSDDNKRLKELPDAIYSLGFSRDGKIIGSSGPYVTRIWDVARRKVVQRLEKCSYSVAFSPITDRLVTCGEFGIYDSQNGERLIELAGDVGVYGCVDYSRDGTLIASGNKEGSVQLWDAETGKEIVLRSGHEGGVRSVAFSPDGTVAASLSREDATLRVWGTTTGKELLKVPVTWRGQDVWWNEEGSDLWFAPYGREIVTWTSDMQVLYCRLGRPGQRSLQLDKSNLSSPEYTSATAMAYSHDGHRMAVMQYSGSSRVTVGIFELDGGKLVASLEPFEGQSSSDAWISSMAFSPDGKLLAVGALGDSLRDMPAPSVQLWHLREKSVLRRRLRSSVSPPGKLCFSPDGTLLATSPTRGTPLQLWQLADGALVHEFPLEADAHGRDPAPIAFSPDGKLLAAADASREIYIWELATKKKTHTFLGHRKAVTSLAFSPGGKTLLSGSEDRTLLLWNVRGAPPVSARLTAAELDGYWEALGDADAKVAAGAAQALSRVPEQTLKLFQRRLTAGPAIDVNELPELIEQLASDDPQTHLKAAALLQSFGRKASSALFEALAEKPDLAARRRIEEVLEFTGEFAIPPNELRRGRAIQLLEQFGSTAAQAMLKKLAASEPPTATGAEAKAALERLRARWRAPRADALR